MSHYVAMVVLASWLSLAALLVMRRRSASGGAAQRNWRAMPGVLIQTFGFALVWWHPTLYPNRQGILVVLAAPLAVASATFALWAIHTLGSHWAVQARLATDHQLITKGPYGIVRHPIYTGFLGLLIATGIVFGEYLPAAVVLYLLGTSVRIRAEETLLKNRFGDSFDVYVKRTPAMIPLPWRKSLR